METFTAPKALVENPHYPEHRQEGLAGLRDETIDTPIVRLINGFNRLPYCFTLQCCWGHFTYPGQEDPYNLVPLPRTGAADKMAYRIAYLALCIENKDPGKRLLDGLKATADLDPQNIQFCCAEWFWVRQVNAYALQVTPDRFKDKDIVLYT